MKIGGKENMQNHISGDDVKYTYLIVIRNYLIMFYELTPTAGCQYLAS